MSRRKLTKREWNEVATFEMHISYETLPKRSELDALIDLARASGMVKRATYTVSKPSQEELV